MADAYIGTKIMQGLVAIQRPVILVVMGISTLAFVLLGFYAIVAFGYPMVTGEAEAAGTATLGVRIGLALLVCISPFLIAKLSWHYAKKALKQIREGGVLYSEQ